MTGIELVAVISSLATLANKLIVENREATEAELEESFAVRAEARQQALDALARARAREAGDD